MGETDIKGSVLVTGGAGYLGNVLTRDLLSEGYQVTCIDNLRYSQGESLKDIIKNKDFIFRKGDVLNEDLLKNIVPRHDILIPLAALVGQPICEKYPEEAKKVNTEAIRLINEIRKEDQKLICPITNSGYGTRSGDNYCTEETPLEPISLYGRTKVEAEKIILGSDKPAIALRLATAFGFSKRMRIDLMANDFVYKALTDKKLQLYEPHFMRNFIHVKDISRAFMHCINNYEGMKNQAYNVGIDSANMSKLDLAKKIKERLPETKIEEMAGRDPDKRNYIISNEKLRKTGFEAKVTMDEGIDELIEGYQNIPCLSEIKYSQYYGNNSG